MNLAEQIESFLRSEYDSGKTQKEMAMRTGITQPHIQRILSDPKKVLGISVRTLMKMFPNATLHIKGNNVVADNSGTNHGVVGVNNGTINGATQSSASSEDFRNKALKSLMDLEIPPDALVKVLKTIKDLHI